MRPAPATYPKTYATVTGLFPMPGEGYRGPWPDWVFARTEAGEQLTLRMSWKAGGKSSSTEVRVGRRIKLFRRPQDDHPSFRLVGD